VPEFEVIQCKKCSLTFINSEADIKPATRKDDIEGHYFSLEAMYRQKAQRDWKQLQAWWRDGAPSSNSGGSVLDVGCGIGLFVEEAKRHGWQAYGVEMNPAAVQYAREHGNLQVTEHDAEDRLPFQSNSIDVVTLFGVIEHLEEPAKALTEGYRVLRPGGVLMIQTPTEDGLLRSAARWLYRLSAGRFVFLVHQLYSLHGGHNVCFSRRSLRILLEQLGFNVHKCVNSTYGLRVLLLRFEGHPWPGRWIKKTATSVLFLLGRMLGLSNHVTVFAVKPELTYESAVH